MIKMIVDVIAKVLGAVGSFFQWKSSGVGQHKAATDIVEDAEQESRDRKHEVNRAVHEGDEETVNRLITGASWLIAAAVFVLAVGCSAAKTTYVASDRRVTCVTNETGTVEYWRVPPLIMEDLLNAKAELGEIKKEQKVKEITK